MAPASPAPVAGTRAGAVAALALAVVLVLAGCNGVAGSERTPTRSVTPAPVPTDATPQSRVTVPGISPRGVENASLLAAAHRERLSDVAFTERTVTTVRDGDAVLARRTLVVRRGTDAFRLGYEVDGAPRRDAGSSETVAAEVWSDGRTSVRSATAGDGSVRRHRLPGGSYATFAEPGASPYARTLERASLRPVDRRVVDGTTRYAFVAEDVVPRPGYGLSGTTPTGGASVRAVVAADGVVHRVTIAFPARYRSRSVTVEHVFEYVDVGTTTAPRPSWYGEAVENGTPEPGARGAD